jgi:methylated-DNA-protein-cysteine methyltransferase-like protein
MQETRIVKPLAADGLTLKGQLRVSRPWIWGRWLAFQGPRSVSGARAYNESMSTRRSRAPNPRGSAFRPTAGHVGLKPDPPGCGSVGLKPDLQASAAPEGDPPPRERIWQVIAAIPPGKVTTYGSVAARAGVPRGARFVGTVLRDLPTGSRLPWHRVLNASGRISVDPVTAREQRERLEAEGVGFVNARVDLSRFGWDR